MRQVIGFMILALLLINTGGAVAQEDATRTPAKAAVEAGESSHTLTVGGIERHYRQYVPPGYDPAQRAPLVISLHGFASNPGQQAWVSKWNDVADAHHFVVIYPQGTGFPLRWHIGQPFLTTPDDVDDIAFLRQLIAAVSETLCIDPARIYVNGLSNGGGISHRVACEMADVVAAIGGVAGAYPPRQAACQPARPIPVMAFHGTDDPIVPYDGGLMGFPPVETWTRDWAERNACDLTPESLPPVGAVTGIRYPDCAAGAEVILYTIAGGGHTWPGGATLPAFLTRATNHDLNASEMLWAFFVAHPLPGGDQSP